MPEKWKSAAGAVCLSLLPAAVQDEETEVDVPEQKAELRVGRLN